MYQQFSAAVITFLISSFGILVNIVLVMSIRKTVSMNGSFGIITKNQAICNIMMCSIFLVFVFPTQVSSSVLLISISNHFGTLSMIVYEISNLSHLTIAMNRFCAMYIQHRYERIFSKTNTMVLRNYLWVFSIAFCTCWYEISKCFFFYDTQTWTFEFENSEFCATLTWFSDFIFNTGLIILTLFMNLVTAYKGRKLSRALINAAGMEVSNVLRKREWNFVRQACCQGLSIFVGQLACYFFAPMIDEDWLVAHFFIATLWAFMHASEGGIIMVSNQELRTIFKKESQEIFAVVRRSSGF
ncbi:7TM GPCR serpentine receptor class x (Srx) domain-containing protein [Caenorhabditis elegans]|uniref:7TM GPCR serpentine receptor class x (Srx) domain-containing protein n=1 Tax=Caenorhabditis elegans TaxID=6239 RepID=Q965G4_CAEEL|nr:7TM GPCR serpentine receptor class x (Srx) domain-containing protein [Caenorhabditis elegans]CCD71071.2 7TM GPCR serpentine receptor class x (Srx) domain-containing protein [Caenorhabditis elegans]|eukprot:NP_001023913.2 Serpentine Receptor, class X [Caenorhabditis elegans]